LDYRENLLPVKYKMADRAQIGHILIAVDLTLPRIVLFRSNLVQSLIP